MAYLLFRPVKLLSCSISLSKNKNQVKATKLSINARQKLISNNTSPNVNFGSLPPNAISAFSESVKFAFTKNLIIKKITHNKIISLTKIIFPPYSACMNGGSSSDCLSAVSVAVVSTTSALSSINSTVLAFSAISACAT